MIGEGEDTAVVGGLIALACCVVLGVIVWLASARRRASERAERARLSAEWEARRFHEQQQADAQRIAADLAAAQAAAAQAQAHAERETAVVDLLAKVRESKGRNLSFDGIEQFYRPKNKERVYWIGRVLLLDLGRGPNETGTLVVTDQRVAFDFDDPARADWAKTWRTIVRWRASAPNDLTVELGSGKPKVFRLSQSLGPQNDSRVVKELMDFARNADAA